MTPQEFVKRFAERSGWPRPDMDDRCRNIAQGRSAELQAEHAVSLLLAMLGTPNAGESVVAAKVYRDLKPVRMVAIEERAEAGGWSRSELAPDALRLFDRDKTLGQLLTHWTKAASLADGRAFLDRVFSSLVIYQNAPVARLRLIYDRETIVEQQYEPEIADGQPSLITGHQGRGSPFKVTSSIGPETLFMIADVLASEGQATAVHAKARPADADTAQRIAV